MDITSELLAGTIILVVSFGIALTLLTAVRLAGNWIMLGRNRVVQLPSSADAGKVEPTHNEGPDASIPVNLRTSVFVQITSDRRVTSEELEEILQGPSLFWARIGANRSIRPLRSDETDRDSTS